jgi:hypothetical protein
MEWLTTDFPNFFIDAINVLVDGIREIQGFLKISDEKKLERLNRISRNTEPEVDLTKKHPFLEETLGSGGWEKWFDQGERPRDDGLLKMPGMEGF